MKNLHMICALEYDDKLMHGDSVEDREWFLDLLMHDNLTVFSPSLGDMVGKLTVGSIKEGRWVSKMDYIQGV
jgi:hypothetical protein